MSELKIEFGSGGRRLPGWQCYDADMPIDKPLPFQENSVDYVFASHVIEHVTMHAAMKFFQNVHWILKPKGTFRISVPVLWRITDRNHALDLIFGNGHLAVYSEQTLKDMLWTAGFDRLEMHEVPRHPVLDIHHLIIGTDKDDLESLRLEAVK